MNILKKVVWVLTVLLSLSTGLVKIFGLEADIAIFSAIGFSAVATVLVGVVQVIGALLLAVPKTMRIGAWIMVVTFALATVAVFASGQIAFGIVSILFILMALWFALSPIEFTKKAVEPAATA